ncbi:LON peptidase substrate-binding domain-containing protein [Streptacidiphilus sp. N1-3]|uniref:LON peptidase substrate-binding domain-containing protein n=1 Tax=Streptacidiphilus alkalitolerans TaxID=3342712 RepID=A0ABV6X970_9ACTN
MTERLPLFPLGTVLYPGLVLPLNVFEERYRRLVADLVAGEEPFRFGVVAIRDGRDVAPTGVDQGSQALAGLGPDPAHALFPVGCVAEIASVEQRKDGGYDLIATGTTRFQVESFDATGPYLTAEVERLPEAAGDEAAVLAQAVERLFRAYQKRLAGARESSVTGLQELPDDPMVLSYLVAAASVLDTGDKQRLLTADSAADRLTAELALLRRENAVLAKLPSLPAVELTRQAFNPN